MALILYLIPGVSMCHIDALKTLTYLVVAIIFIIFRTKLIFFVIEALQKCRIFRLWPYHNMYVGFRQVYFELIVWLKAGANSNLML